MSETNNSESSNSNLHSMIIPSSSESSCSPSILNQVNKQVASPQFTKLVDPLTASRKQVRDDVPNTTASIDTLSRKQVRDHDVPNTTASICTLNVHHPRVNPDCVASFSQIPVSKTVLSTVTTVTELLESVHKIILHIPKDQTDCYRVGQIIILVLQILNLECKTIGTDSSNHSYFPWILLKEYHQGVQLLQKNLDQTNAAEFMQELSLNITSSWLGKEFHKMSNSISDKVDKFKSEHITSIDNLPPSEQVIDALFPRCMKILFSSWIGIKENERQQQTEHQESSASDDSQAGTDSLKVPQHQPPKQKFSRYPLVQLILEFANQTLISGVAHVLYSRLIHQ
uniref:Uncharacterized protein LOC102807855 n=1 Tax=Saccoglossus kowalevskii TaxID=10224 RepID=A0ABM0MSK2_SACKO|nr:PREDICTED: uncharacterized protein LOC102807855 [Saccoglossus kowalevskii]